MKTSKIFYFLGSMVLLGTPFVLIALYWDQLPDQIPTHYNLRGEVDRYGSKYTIFILPGVNIGMYLLISMLPQIDPKKNFGEFKPTFRIIQFALLAFLFLLFAFLFLDNLGWKINVVNLIFYFMMILFLVLGNYLGKIRPNYFIGVRTPWTLENEEIWRKTHRLTGKLWVIGSLITFGISLFVGSTFLFILLSIFCGLCTLIPLLYSYRLYAKLEKNSQNISL